MAAKDKSASPFEMAFTAMGYASKQLGEYLDPTKRKILEEAANAYEAIFFPEDIEKQNPYYKMRHSEIFTELSKDRQLLGSEELLRKVANTLRDSSNGKCL
ncbi:MAG: hypothetical protein M1355_01765 [Patescibacteria group bacterium]|nr:hypothetical protein [Patescibacteria group bacterium]